MPEVLFELSPHAAHAAHAATTSKEQQMREVPIRAAPYHFNERLRRRLSVVNRCSSPPVSRTILWCGVALDAARRWVNLATKLHRELREVAELASIDPRWWVLAGGAAYPWSRAPIYVVSDAEAAADTFIGHVRAAPPDPIAHAIARAHAARAALLALDGKLPGQPLAVTIRRDAMASTIEPSALELVAFAIGDRGYGARLGDDRALALELAAVIANPHARTTELQPLGEVTPFVTITLGDEPIATARHGHRRGWITRGGVRTGPWLGLSRSYGLDLVTTCHMVVDGFGHAWLANEIRERTTTHLATSDRPVVRPIILPSPVIPGDAIALDVAWQELSTTPRALELAYRLGCALPRLTPRARFSPTFQIPVAPGARDDADRFKRRVVPAIASVRFEAGRAEPFAEFAARTKLLLAREAAGAGVSAHLLAAAQAVPVPLAWKRHAVGTARPAWLDAIANLIGGRGSVSKISGTPGVAASAPGRLATAVDPVGSCVVSLLHDADHATLTVCSSGIDARKLLNELTA